MSESVEVSYMGESLYSHAGDHRRAYAGPVANAGKT